ncbi:MAG: ATP-binding protein [Phocaeicola sp.]
MFAKGWRNPLFQSFNSDGSIEIILIVVLSALLLALMYRRVRYEVNKSKLLSLQLVDAMNLFIDDQTLEVFTEDRYTKKLYIYKDGQHFLHSQTFEEYAKLIHPEDVEILNVLKEELSDKKKNRTVAEVRYYDAVQQKYSYYEFIIVVLERNSEGRVKRYAFSRRNTSKEKVIVLQQKNLIDELNLSLQIGRLFRWNYNFALKTTTIIDYQGVVREIKSNFLYLIAPKDRRKLLRYFVNVLNNNEEDSEITVVVYNPEKQENRNCRFTAKLQKDEKGNPVQVYGILKDVTEEEKMLRHYVELEKKTRMALELGAMSTWQYDCKREVFIVLHGGPIERKTGDVLSKEFIFENIHPDDRKKLKEDIQKTLARELECSTQKYRYKTADGWRWFLNKSTPVIEDGIVTSVIGVRREITGEVELQEGLESRIVEFKEQGDSLLRILDSLPIPIAFRDLDSSQYTYMNKAYTAYYGVQVENRSPLKVISTFKSERVGNLKNTDSSEFAEIVETKDGRILNTIVRSTLIEYNGAEQLLISRIDLTELIQAKRYSRLFNSIMPALKAFTWFFNTLTREANIRHNMKLERDISNFSELSQVLNIIHPDDRAGALENLIKYIRQEKDGLSSYCFRSDIEQIGVYEWWEYNAAIEVVKENDQEYCLVSGITINVNERKLAEEEFTRLNSLSNLVLSNVDSLLVYITSDYDVIWGNAETAFSGKVKHIYKASGGKCYRLKGFDKPCEDCPMRTTLLTHEVTENEIFLEDGSWIRTIAIPIPAMNGMPEGALLRVDDVSEYKRLISDLETSMTKAEEADKLKSAFLANMSHEIRTPLNAIVGFSELLLTTDDEVEKQEYVHVINSNNELLLRLIGDILDLSKIEAGSMKLYPETFDFSAFFQETYISLKPRFERTGVDFLIQNSLSECIVTLDKNRCLQVITNYLNNAIKFTQQGYVKMGCNYKDNGLFVFVEDTGIGISEDKMNLLFLRFEKLDTFAQGTGLGLSICKAIAESMGGEVGCDSVEGKGSTFWAWFPCEIDAESK